MKITKYPQSAILIEDYKSKRILIDPGSYCYNENFNVDNFGKIDILLLTHDHLDHYCPEAIRILKQNNSKIIILSNKEVQKKLKKDVGLDCEILEVGEERQINNIKIKGTKQIHGDLPNGKPKPEVIGFLVDDKFYHPGDTIYLKEKPYAEIVFAPICGTVVMDVNEAVKFIEEIRPKLAIPIHYDNPKYFTEINNFTKEVKNVEVKVLENGQSIKF